MLTNPVTARTRATYGQIAQTVLINWNVIYAQSGKPYRMETGKFPENVGFSTLQAWKHKDLPILAGSTTNIGQLGMEAEETQDKKANRNDPPLLNIISQNRQYFNFADVRHLLDKAQLWGCDDSWPRPPSHSHLSRQCCCCSFLRPCISLAAIWYCLPLLSLFLVPRPHAHHELPVPPHHDDSWRNWVAQVGYGKVLQLIEMDPGGKPYSSVCQLLLDKPYAQIIKPISWIH